MHAFRFGIVALLAALISVACRISDPDREMRGALAEVLASAPVSPAIERALGPLPTAVGHALIWEDVRAFYRHRANTPAWVSREGPTLRADAALGVLRQAPAHGLRATDYGTTDLETQRDAILSLADAPDEAYVQTLAVFETRLTAAMLALGRDVAFGRTNPQMVDSRWRARRPAIDLPRQLSEAADGDPATWLDRVRPPHPEYAALQRALARVDGVDDRAIVALNLERWRWMPDDLGARHLLVNVPEYHLYVREGDQIVLDSRVIVGKRGNETPVFSSTMTTVVFSPYWHIPDTIAAGETVPAVVRDPSYLARNRIDVLRVTPAGTTRVDPATIDWGDPVATRDLVFRQRPGETNALGHVKFLLPNPYTVYLHDTPADDLFARAGRALSHGCVRVERARALASYVLRDDPDWDNARIDAAMRAGVERTVTLRTPLPVHVVYFTASVSADGEVHRWPDVYGYAARQQRASGTR